MTARLESTGALVSKRRRSSGPDRVHAWNQAAHLTWCGRRLRGAVWHREGDLDSVTCPTCRVALRDTAPRPYRRGH